MGKKYIIELESGTHIFVLGPEGIVHIGETDVVYETIDGMQIGDAVINAKPYTEPDLEQIRKEAYEQGRKDVETQFCSYDACKNRQEEYQRGLADAWEAAKKIALMDTETSENVTGYFGLFRIMENLTPMQAIEKIRQYEQEKEEIKVGNEIAFHHDDGRPDTVVVVTYIGQDGFIDGMDGRGTQYAHKNPKKWTKTGRDFPELVAVIEKMREGQDE